MTSSIQNLNMLRTRDHEPNVEKVWKRGRWPGSGLDKVPLAEALWPVLERKVKRAIRRGTAGPPVMRACMRAYEMLAVSERVPVALRRQARQPVPSDAMRVAGPRRKMPSAAE